MGYDDTLPGGGDDGVPVLEPEQPHEFVPNDEPPNYVMFAITFVVIAFSIYKYFQVRAARGPRVTSSAPRIPRPAATQTRQPPRQDRFFNGGVGAGGGGSGTMVEAPPSPSPGDSGGAINNTAAIERIIGSELVGGNAQVSTSKALATSRIVGLYFSAHWCGPCRQFTPQLINFYNAVRRAHGPGVFEIVFVSSDKSRPEFDKYFSSMPWLAVKFANAASVKRHFGSNVKGIPTLLLVSPTSGKVLDLSLIHI